MITALGHWIWQGVVLVAVVSLCLSRARQVSASMRYRVWWATLALVVALPFLQLLDMPGFGAVLGISGPVEVQMMAAPGSAPTPESTRWVGWLPMLALAGWMSWSLTRFYAAFAHLDAAKRSCRPFPIVRERALAQWKAARNRGRRATLVVSAQVRAAAVLGLGYPRIAVAPTLVSSLSDDELDQLVLHEYAHVQRRDDLASLIQLAVKGLVGWHPAVWWIDRRLRIEREVACDDWVLATTGAPRTYARCLTRIADMAVGSESSLMPAATRTPQLTTRVMRLLDARRSTSIRPSGAALALATTVLAMVSVGLSGNHTSVIALPSVARVTTASGVDTPELSFARLIQALTEPASRGMTSPRRSIAAAARADEAAAGQPDVVHAAAVTTEPTEPAVGSAVADAMAPQRSSPESTREPMPAEAAAPAASATAVAADAPPAVESDDSWVDVTRRALAEAGKATGQSLAEAGKSTGSAVADASVAAARGTQKSVVKAGRFFSRLGRSLAKPF